VGKGTNFKFCTHSHGIDRNKSPLKNVGKIRWAYSYAGTLKNFQSTHIGYRAHRAVIFAIAWHLVWNCDPTWSTKMLNIITIIVSKMTSHCECTVRIREKSESRIRK